MKLGPIALITAFIMCAGCAGTRRAPQTPSHEQLVLAHLKGDYGRVSEWCPRILRDRNAIDKRSEWCLFALPAALWLSFDSEGALGFVAAACVDQPTQQAIAGSDFREFYVSELVRWIALPLRAQGQHSSVAQVVGPTLRELAAACRVDPVRVREQIDTEIHR